MISEGRSGQWKYKALKHGKYYGTKAGKAVLTHGKYYGAKAGEAVLTHGKYYGAKAGKAVGRGVLYGGKKTLQGGYAIGAGGVNLVGGGMRSIQQRKRREIERQRMDPRSPLPFFKNQANMYFGAQYRGRLLEDPRADEWPAIEDAGFNTFVAQLLTNKLPSHRTQDFTAKAVPKENTCTKLGKIKLESYQALLPKLVGKNSPLTRLLYVASTGSGKTCGLHAMAHAMGRDLSSRVVIIVPTKTIASEMYKQGLKCPGPVRDILADQQGLSWDNKEDQAAIESFMNQSFELLTYAQAGIRIGGRLKGAKTVGGTLVGGRRVGGTKVGGTRVGGDINAFDNRVVFLDEVHNLVDSPVLIDGKLTPTYVSREELNAYRSEVRFLYEHLGKSKNAIIIGMTATPIKDIPEQLLMLVNSFAGKTLLNPDTFNSTFVENGVLTTDPAKLNRLRRAFKGMFAIYDNQMDTHRFPETRFHDLEVAYSEAQEAAMTRNIIKENNVNFSGSDFRKGEIKKMKSDEMLARHSPKLLAVVDNVLKITKGKQVIYSRFGNRKGGVAILDLLVQRGFHIVDNASQLPESNGIVFIGNRDGKPMLKHHMDERIELFNSDKCGTRVRVIILTGKDGEGVDLVGARSLHMVEQPKDPGTFTQIVGRCRRFCSHKDQKFPDNWKVDVYTYTGRSKNPTTSEPDREGRDERAGKARMNSALLAVAGSTALDCVPNKSRTGFKCVK